MVGSLKNNLEIAVRLIRNLKDQSHRELAQIILIGSKCLLLNAHDLYDQQLLSSGYLVPNYSLGSVHQAVHELVKIISLRVTNKEIKIKCDLSKLKQYPTLEFDKLRLQ